MPGPIAISARPYEAGGGYGRRGSHGQPRDAAAERARRFHAGRAGAFREERGQSQGAFGQGRAGGKPCHGFYMHRWQGSKYCPNPRRIIRAVVAVLTGMDATVMGDISDPADLAALCAGCNALVGFVRVESTWFSA